MNPALLLVILCLGVATASSTAPTSLDAQRNQGNATYQNPYDLNEEGSVRGLSEESIKMIRQLLQKYMEVNGSNFMEMLSNRCSFFKGFTHTEEDILKDLKKLSKNKPRLNNVSKAHL